MDKKLILKLLDNIRQDLNTLPYIEGELNRIQATKNANIFIDVIKEEINSD